MMQKRVYYGWSHKGTLAQVEACQVGLKPTINGQRISRKAYREFRNRPNIVRVPQQVQVQEKAA